MKNKVDERPLLRLFVYGTLKRGGRNYRRFCARSVSVSSATVWGRLYLLSQGFPALELAEESILAKGTAHPHIDTFRLMQRQKARLPFDRPLGDWGLIRGELIVFANPMRDLPPIDCLEGFYPNRISLYQRVMIVVQSRHRLVTAWTYCMEHIDDMQDSKKQRIMAGRWPCRVFNGE
jgi:gamma-glutamylcyclotransferase (GGCT)/AIG2-like uncharacterized protein YtfP